MIDRAYLDLGARATLTFGLGLHVRYFGAALPALAILQGGDAGADGSLQRARRRALGALRAGWASAASGASTRIATPGAASGYAAGELRLPRLLGDAGGLRSAARSRRGGCGAALLYGQIVARLWGRLADPRARVGEH